MSRGTFQSRRNEIADGAGAPFKARPASGDRLAETEDFDLAGILSSLNETANSVDAVADRIDWESDVFGIIDGDAQSRIARYADIQGSIAREQAQMGAKAVLSGQSAGQSVDSARGVPYRARFESYLEKQQNLFRSDADELSRQRFTEAISASLVRSVQKRQTCGLLMMSVNNLAVINDTLGHAVGDEVLASVDQSLRSALRAGDVLGRYSSAEFGVIVQNCSRNALRIAAERFMTAVRDSVIRTATGELSATISVGGVVMPTQATVVPDALNMALQALEKAKSRLFECFFAHEASVGTDLERARNKAIADGVIAAIDEQRMRLVLQPLIGAASARAEIYECRLRMERKDGRLVSASEFIPIAEQLGLARLIDRRTLELAVDLLKQHAWLKLSINVSGLTCSDHEWLVALRRLTGSRPDLLRRLVVEITETAATQGLDQSISFVDALKELGCRVAIKDFGAGYTSIEQLKMLNVDMIKIDGAFVRNLTNNAADQIFAKTMIDLARTLNLETVAEWVDDAQSADHLMAAGVTYLQGAYFGMPIDAADISRAA